MRKWFTVLAITAAVALTCAIAEAKGRNMQAQPEPAPGPEAAAPVLPQGPGPVILPQGGTPTAPSAGVAGLTPEKQALFDAIVRQTSTTMLPLREAMTAKLLELQALSAGEQLDRQAIAQVCRDVAAIHTQMIMVHEQMADRLEKEVGVSIQRGSCGGCPMESSMGMMRRQHGQAMNPMGPRGQHMMPGMMGGQGGHGAMQPNRQNQLPNGMPAQNMMPGGMMMQVVPQGGSTR